MEQINQCPVCQNNQFSPYISCVDYTVSNQSFSLSKCKSCSFVFTNPRPNKDEIGAYYKAENYISHTETKSGLVNQIYHIARKFTLKNKLNLINKLSQKGALLDIGCGTGSFLNIAQKNGWKVNGVEPDTMARELALKHCGNVIFDESFFQNETNTQFEVITLWHVLEHIHELELRIKQIKKLLKPSGRLIVAVPNCSSGDAQHYKQYWAAYDVPRHLYHFTPKDIQNLFQNFDFQLETILPMKLDAFYVSILSEKYKKGSFISGVFYGLLSNIRAASKKHTYSSQIYILKHN